MKQGFLPPLTLLTLLTIGGIYLFALTSLPPDSFWSNDDGTKFLVVHNLAQRNSFAPHIEYPARDLDPELKYQPLPPPMGFVQKGEVYGIYSNAFPVFSLPFYKWLSYRGLYFLPLFFGLAALAMLALFFKTEPEKILIITLSAFCTPLFFYSINFWDHTPAVFFTLIAFYWAWRGIQIPSPEEAAKSHPWYLVGAGLMMALGEVFRDEAYGFGAGLFLAVLWWARPRKGILYYLLGQILGLIPLWLINYRTFGHPLGPHFSRQASIYGYGDLWLVFTRSCGVFWTYLFGMQPVLWSGVFLAASAFLLLTIFRLHRRKKISFFLLGAGCSLYGLAALVTLILTLRLPDPILNSQFVNTLFSGTPYLIFLLLGMGLMQKEEDKKFWVFAGVIMAVHLLFAALIPMAGGLQWGMRYLLILYPLFLLLAYQGAKASENQFTGKSKIFIRGFFIFLLLIALVSQAFGYYLLGIKKREGKQLWRDVADMSQEVLVTDLPWASQEGAAIFYQKKMLYVSSPQALGMLTAALKARGLKSFSFLTHRLNSWADTPAVASLGLQPEKVNHLKRPRLDYMDLLLVNYRIL